MKQKKVIGLILSLALVLCVAIPGTLASENINQPVLVCEKPVHTHDANCWTVSETPECGMEAGAGAHIHDGGCYGYVEGLICTLPEDENHTHTDQCRGVLKDLVCTLPADENHAHTDSCYAPRTALTCGLTESTGHVHSAECYPTVLSCTQEEHTHDAGCYAAPHSEEENETTCTCGSVDGTHIEGCPLYVAPPAPTCTCGSVDGTHIEGCPLYVAPPAPTCTCGSVDGIHVEGCPLYVAPTCTCGSVDGIHVEGCALYVAPVEEFQHIEGCSEECTDEECTCLCHLFDRLMACQTAEEFFIMLEQYTNEEIEATLSEEEVIQAGQKIDSLMPQPLPEIVLDENGNVVSDELSDVPSDEEPFISEVEYVSVNFDYVAPFGDPVVG